MSKATPPSPKQMLLGGFILFQLAFLLLSNLLGFVKSIPKEMPEEPAKLMNRVAPHFVDGLGHGWQWSEQLETNLTSWMQLTGQDQEWALFAPAVGKGTGFPCLVLLWDDKRFDDPAIQEELFTFDVKNGFHMRLDLLAPKARLLLSENEPKDVREYLRLGKCRLRRYEGQLYVNSQPREKETPDETAARVNDSVRYLLKHYQELTRAYMQWRLKAWQSEHPDEPAPKQIILCERFYRIHEPTEAPGWDGPSLVPLIRWRPALDRPDGFRSLETFDFTTQRFSR
jgi:hypothetical protein